jgi:hypothetical protein
VRAVQRIRVFKLHGQWCMRCEVCPNPETRTWGTRVPGGGWDHALDAALRHDHFHRLTNRGRTRPAV